VSTMSSQVRCVHIRCVHVLCVLEDSYSKFPTIRQEGFEPRPAFLRPGAQRRAATEVLVWI
ncbi:hypothetical protein E4U34_000171, partial [Claviceps purpurea]